MDNEIFDINKGFIDASELLVAGSHKNDKDLLLKAIEMFKKIVEIEPDYAEAFYNIALAYYYLAEFASSIIYYSKVLELDPNDHEVLLERASLYAKTKEFKKAIDDYTKAIDYDKENASLYHNRGLLYGEIKDYTMAISDLNQAIKFDSGKAHYYYNLANFIKDTGDYKLAIKDYDKAIELNPKDDYGFINKGICLAKLNEHDAAIENYQMAVKICPENYLSYYNCAHSFDILGNYEKVIENYTKVINIAPENINAFINRGIAYTKIKKYNDALDDFKMAINIEPRHPLIFYNRGITFNAMKMPQEAIEDYSMAISLNPYESDCYFNRGNIYFKRKEFFKAFADFIQAIELDLNYALTHYFAYYDQVKSNNLQKDLTLINKAIKINPDKQELLLNKIILLDKSFKFKEAFDLNELIKIPQTEYIYLNKIILNTRLKKYDTALNNVADLPDNIANTAYSGLISAVLNIACGNFDSAESALDKVLKLSKSSFDKTSFVYILKFLISKITGKNSDNLANTLHTQVYSKTSLLSNNFSSSLVLYIDGRLSIDELLGQADTITYKTIANLFIGLNLLAQNESQSANTYFNWIIHNANKASVAFIIAQALNK